MELPRNAFKHAIAAGQRQIGCWVSLPGTVPTEIAAGAGYDWVLLDMEHSPIDPVSVLPLLQTAAAYPVSAIVRPPANDAVLIKRVLDVGAQTLLIPFVQNVAEAEAAVSAMRYPPRGIRGVAGTTRATRFGRIKDYAARAADELCLLVQVETMEAMEHLEAIAAVDGVDGVFIGPADLAASMGYPGGTARKEVHDAIVDAVRRLNAVNVPAGVLSPDHVFCDRLIEAGVTFLAVDVDTAILARGVAASRQRFA